MCLDIKKYSKKRIATKDIVCYKMIIKTRSGYLTYFRFSPITIGKTYKSKLKKEIRYNYDLVWDAKIQEGLHSYAEFKKTDKNNKNLLQKVNLEYWVKCIIPKGATYYKGTFGFHQRSSYASDTLKYVEIL